MAQSAFYIPSINLIGAGCLATAVGQIQGYGFKRALIVTDKVLNDIGLAGRVAKLLGEAGIAAAVFDGAQPNPTVGNVEAGLALLRRHEGEDRKSVV